MTPLSIDFARRPPVRLWLWASLLAALLVAISHSGCTAWQLQQELRAARQQEAEARTRYDTLIQARRNSELAAQSRPPYERDALLLARTASFDWNGPFAALESTRIEGIRVLAIDASATESSVHVDLEFAEAQQLLRYLDAINAGEPPWRWMLARAQAPAAGALGQASIEVKLPERSGSR